MYILLIFLSAYPPKNLQPISRVTVPWETENNQTFYGLLDTDSELKVILRDLKCPVVYQSQQGLNGCQVINGVLAQICLTVRPMDPQTHPVVIFPVLE